MKLPIYFVSDNHFFMDSPPNEAERRKLLFSLFEKIKDEKGTLIIGGDFFDFWFDYGKNQPSGYDDIFNELRNLSLSGVEIHYVLGNHDYWDFGYFNKQFNAIVHRENFEFTINNKKNIITHGDGLLSGDSGYRFMRKIIRSKICIFLFRLLGGDIGCAIAKKISNTSKKYNHSERHNKKNNVLKENIRNEINNYIINNWFDKFDTVLIGHYHQTGIDKIEDNKKIIYLGDWLNYYTVTCLKASGWEQLSWKEK